MPEEYIATDSIDNREHTNIHNMTQIHRRQTIIRMAYILQTKIIFVIDCIKSIIAQVTTYHTHAAPSSVEEQKKRDNAQVKL